MSWHTGGLLIHVDASADYPSLLQKLGLYGWQSTSSMISFEEATCVSMTDLAVGCVKGWTTLWSNLVLDYLDLNSVKDLSANADVFLMNLEGSCGFAHFAWWSGGRLVRRRLVCEGEVEVDEGDPLSPEAAIFSATDDEEDRVFSLMSELVFPAERLYEARYVVYKFPDITDRQPSCW
jgi:hypothetical protein